MRSEFEKLPEIAEIIKEHGAFYCDKGEWYLCPDDQFSEYYLDGAWYAFQEQQKKIDAVKKLCNAYWLDDDRDYNIYIQDIEKLLK